LLAKCDLVSEVVLEFPELQGVMGYHYALKDNEGMDCALAIKEHYYPRFSGDVLPSNLPGVAVALADKLDTLMGIFGINQLPTGDKDPFALRRAALGVIRLLIEKNLPLDLLELLQKAKEVYALSLPNLHVIEQTLTFIQNRLKALYLEQNVPPETFEAVMACQSTQLVDFDNRLKAVQKFQTLPEASALSAANKRVNNILKKQSVERIPSSVDEKLLQLEIERVLFKQIQLKTGIVNQLCDQKNYAEALSELSTLKDSVDTFFDEVMVMDENEAMRMNRLSLFVQLKNLLSKVADISLLN
jgi:glycyl-tRNA synthetase beta chain